METDPKGYNEGERRWREALRGVMEASTCTSDISILTPPNPLRMIRQDAEEHKSTSFPFPSVCLNVTAEMETERRANDAFAVRSPRFLKPTLV